MPITNLNMSPDFYESNAESYHAQTSAVDPSSFLLPLAKRLKPGATILDLGCGSGRDLRWFKEQGFAPLGCERAPSLARLARAQSGCEVLVEDFTQHNWNAASFDALLMIGALVHIEHAALPAVLAQLLTTLHPGGYALLSLKEGQGLRHHDDGRVFSLWQTEALEAIFAGLDLELVEFSRQVSKIRNEDVWLGYLLRRES